VASGVPVALLLGQLASPQALDVFLARFLRPVRVEKRQRDERQALRQRPNRTDPCTRGLARTALPSSLSSPSPLLVWAHLSRPPASASPAVSAPAAEWWKCRRPRGHFGAKVFAAPSLSCEKAKEEAKEEEEKAKEEKEQRRRRREVNESRMRESGKEKGKDEVIVDAKHLLVADSGPSLRRGLDPRSGQGG